jgi:hypothetical protein
MSFLYQIKSLLRWSDQCEWSDERLALALEIYVSRNLARLGLQQ